MNQKTEIFFSRRRAWPFAVIVLALALTLAACAGSQAPGQPDLTGLTATPGTQPSTDLPQQDRTSKQQGIPAQTDEAGIQGTNPDQATDAAPEAMITETSPPAPEASPPTQVPAPRTELVASSPGQFTLASGEYQLVEFFAFW